MSLVLESDQIFIKGDLSFDTALDVWRQGCRLLEQTNASSVTFDFSQLRHCDSAGIAVLLDWLRMAARRKQLLFFAHMPDQMIAIAQCSGIQELLPTPKQESIDASRTD